MYFRKAIHAAFSFGVSIVDRRSCEQFFQQLNRFEVLYFCTDDYPAYRHVIPKDEHIATKSKTRFIEGFNSRVRRYLARSCSR